MNPRNRTLIIVLAAALVVLMVGVIAFLVGGGDDSSDAGGSQAVVEDTGGNDNDGTSPSLISQTRPVEVTGDPLPPLEDPANDVAVGLATPVLDGASFNSTPMRIGGPTDGPTMYVFLAHWCPHCNDEIPELIELQERGDIPPELNVVGISTGVDPSGPNYPPYEWILVKDWPWPIMADDETSTAFVVFGGSGFPYTVMADADGNVLARFAGSRSADDIKAWIDAVLASAAA